MALHIAGNIDPFAPIDDLLDARRYHIHERAYMNPEALIAALQSLRPITVGVDIRIGH